MLDNAELTAIAATTLLWVAARVTRLAGRRRAAIRLAYAAVVATVLTVALLEMGTGHRA